MRAILVKNISKRFKVFQDKSYSLKEKMLFRRHNKYEYRKVLQDVSFEVEAGEGIGIVGKNGCGKSTLLKMLTRIIYPDQGEIVVRGRVSSLIELGAGFHPDMSGRENIYTNASILGLTRKEIDARLDTIIAFSELEEFMDNPIRTYSSGMYMRLAFAVAVNVDADVLLIDEILAVGDANFQKKCFDELKKMKKNGTTIVIVSHSLAQIEEICERSIWIDQGKIARIGTTAEVHKAYLDYMDNLREVSSDNDIVDVSSSVEEEIAETGITINSVMLLDENGEESYNLKTWESGILRVYYTTNTVYENLKIGFSIRREDNLLCYETTTQTDNIENIVLKESGLIEVIMAPIPFLPSVYYIDVWMEEKNQVLYKETNACTFTLSSEVQDTGISRVQHQWIID